MLNGLYSHVVPKRIRRNAVASRENILDHAIPILAKHGISDASLRRITKACAVSQPGILYHFKNKEGLVEAAIRRIVLHNHLIVSQATAPQGDALSRLRKHFQANLRWAKDYPEEAQLILLIYYLASFRKHFSNLYVEILEKARGRICEIILEGIGKKQFEPRPNVQQLGQLLHDALLGGIVNEVTQLGCPINVKSVHQKWEGLFADVLHLKK